MKLTDSRLVTICLVLLGVILTAGLLADRFLLVAAMLAASSVLFMTAGSPIRVVSLILAIQIVFTIAQLTMTQIFVGFFSVRVDDLLSIWLIWLWLLSLPDRSMRGIRYGVTGFWIGLFLVLAGYSAYSGLTTGNDAQFVGEQLKTFGVYLFYFPMLWVLSRKEAWRTLWRVLMTSAVVSGFIFMLKGVPGPARGSITGCRQVCG